MNTNLTYRFDEVMTAVDLLTDDPSMDGDDTTWVIPNGTRDLHEVELISAIMCQSFKRDNVFQSKLAAVLASTAVMSIKGKMEQGEEPDTDDVHALAICANINWAQGSSYALFKTLSMIADLCMKFDIEMPHLATIIFRDNEQAHKFGNLNPYEILNGTTTSQDVQDLFRKEDI